jgi:hypothetical protein
LEKENRLLQQRAEQYDLDAKRWEDDRQKFLDETRASADRLRITDPIKLADIKAKDQARYVQEVSKARVRSATDRLAFDSKLAAEPRVKISSPGQLEIVRRGQETFEHVVPDVIQIRHRKFVLPPGEAVEVPQTVAVRWEEIQRSRQEAKDRASAVQIKGSNMKSQAEVAKAWGEVNRKYGSTDPFMLVAEE